MFIDEHFNHRCTRGGEGLGKGMVNIGPPGGPPGDFQKTC
jgi:hypothetical protein